MRLTPRWASGKTARTRAARLLDKQKQRRCKDVPGFIDPPAGESRKPEQVGAILRLSRARRFNVHLDLGHAQYMCFEGAANQLAINSDSAKKRYTIWIRDRPWRCAKAARITAPAANHFGSMTFSPLTRSKCFRLNVATSLPRSKAVAATMMS